MSLCVYMYVSLCVWCWGGEGAHESKRSVRENQRSRIPLQIEFQEVCVSYTTWMVGAEQGGLCKNSMCS